jgi:sarcosine oxidase subunit beta
VQFDNAIDIKLSQLSFAKLQRFTEETGGDSGYVPAGYLWLASTPQELAALTDALDVQRANGVTNACEVNVDEIAALNPAISRHGIIGGTYCPTDGFIRPLQILDGYRAAAEKLGVRFLYDAEVMGFDKDKSGSIMGVRTMRDSVSTAFVVNAAGAWAGYVARLAGASLPVEPVRRQVALTRPTDIVDARSPMTVYVEDGFHFRVRDGRVLLLLATPGATDPFDVSVEDEWIDRVTDIARSRIPALADVRIDRAGSWAGLYEQSPDGHAIVGTALEIKNFYYANGSSGHGVMHAPALGQLVSELIVDGTASIDISALRPGRFRDAAAHPGESRPL